MKLRNKICAITGAGQGIGRAAAELFAADGANVIILEIDQNKGREVEDLLAASGKKAFFITTDLSDPQSVKNAFAQIQERFGRLDVLYNNASIFSGKHDAPVSELSIDIWHKILGCNLHGLFYCCKYAIPVMLNNGGGSIINTSSSAGVIGIPNCDAYTATKGATVSLTKSMAVEYGPQNIRVNCIAPAAIRTQMVYESNLNDPDFDEELFLRTTPLRRWGSPEDIAKVAMFLASEDSSYLNGAIIVADGGITIT